MRVEINLPKGDAQTRLRDHLDARLRGRMPASRGSAGFQNDGSFVSVVSGPFVVGIGEIPTEWRYYQAADGTLQYIEVVALSQSAPAEWEHEASSLLNSVLADTLADRIKPHFSTNWFSYIGQHLAGEYWLGRVRFAPIWPEDDQPHLLNAERVITIDQNVLAIDQSHAWEVAREASARFAARLSLLLNVGLRDYPQHDQRWFWPIVDGQPADKSIRAPLGFHGFGQRLTVLPGKGTICKAAPYVGSVTDPYRRANDLLTLPQEARRLLRAIDNASLAVTDSFDRAARLYRTAAIVGRQFPSVGLSYRIAAVEAISKSDPSCGSFSEFMRKYVNHAGY
jgi:hypothetical protein